MLGMARNRRSLKWVGVACVTLAVVWMLAMPGLAQDEPAAEPPPPVGEAAPAPESAPQPALQVADAPAAADAPDVPVMGQGRAPNVVELFNKTNPLYINYILLALSIISLLLFVYLVLSLTTGGFIPARLIDDVTKQVLAGQFSQAINLCQNRRSVFSLSIIQRCIENRDKGQGVLLDILDAEGRRRAEVIWNRIGYLSEIANIAPMLGLLGTVIGMIKVFFTLDTRTVGLKAAMMSQGIGEAMATTLFGLIVAILAGVFYAVSKGRATRVLADTEQVCHTVADHVHRTALKMARSASRSRSSSSGKAKP